MYIYVVKEPVSLKGHSPRLTIYGSDLFFFLITLPRKIILDYHWPCKIWPQISVLELIIIFIYIFYYVFIYLLTHICDCLYTFFCLLLIKDF